MIANRGQGFGWLVEQIGIPEPVRTLPLSLPEVPPIHVGHHHIVAFVRGSPAQAAKLLTQALSLPEHVVIHCGRQGILCINLSLGGKHVVHALPIQDAAVGQSVSRTTGAAPGHATPGAQRRPSSGRPAASGDRSSDRGCSIYRPAIFSCRCAGDGDAEEGDGLTEEEMDAYIDQCCEMVDDYDAGRVVRSRPLTCTSNRRLDGSIDAPCRSFLRRCTCGSVFPEHAGLENHEA